jgi:hypothetical protein
MPVATGLYCYLFAGIVYAVCGTSRQLAVGPDVVGRVDAGNNPRRDGAWRSCRYTGMAAATALLAD